MSEPNGVEHSVDDLAEDFARQWRAGARPSVEDYAIQYPQWADDLRAVLPAVLMMEQLKPHPEERPAALPATPPYRLGGFRVVRVLGRGGMGVVYEAEQEALGRRVALKVLPGNLLAEEKVRARFRREAQAAARLHHTNIVPVFEVGEHDGQCYYAMQLIRGQGLDQVIRRVAAARGGDPVPAADPDRTHLATPTPTTPADAGPLPEDPAPAPGKDPGLAALSPRAFCREVARIGVQVAEALGYAHSQGVLHRDIKPSNLLLDERGGVWVTDFGVAKLVEEANLTQSGDLVGTLRYMPPERFAGRSDARGDVYSLGVTLYEMLTLKPAFPDATPHHLIQLITQECPARPRALNPQVPTDLENVVLKAAARDPARRYQTPGDLAEDLRRFLDDRPVRARRAGVAERLWRWGRRHPAAAVVFLSLVAVAAVALVAYAQTAAAHRATAAANRDLEKALGAEMAQREQAEQTSTLALDALNRTFDRFAPARLVAAPPADDAGADLLPPPTLPPEAIPLVEDLLLAYEKIAHAAEKYPRLYGQAAEANHRIGDIHQRLGRHEQAVTAYRTARDLYGLLPPDADGGKVRIQQARCCNDLGRALRALHRFDEAEAVHGAAVRTLADAPPAFAARPECRYELARSHYALGQRVILLNPPRSGPDHPHGPNDADPGRPAISLLEKLVKEFPKVPEYRHLLACCYRDLAPAFGPDGPKGPRGPKGPKGGKGPKEVGGPPHPDHERAVDLLRQLMTEFPKVPDYRFDLCETLARKSPEKGKKGPGDGKQRVRLEEAVALSAVLVGQYPTVPDYTLGHARYLDLLGVDSFHAGDFARAETLHRQAITYQAALVKQYPDVAAYQFYLGLTERSLGDALGRRGELPEARSWLESSVNRLEVLVKKDARLKGVRPFLGLAYGNLARVLTDSGEPVLAAAARRRAEEHGGEHGPKPRP